MIWVLDNGQDYSDHQTVFVEAPDGFDMYGYIAAELDRQRLIWGDAPTSFWYVVGSAREFAWHRGQAMQLEKLQDEIDYGVRYEQPRVDWRSFQK